MPSTHKWDIVATTGEYSDSSGAVKKRNRTIGKIMTLENGRDFMLLDPFVNVGALPRQGDMVMLSLFAPRQDDKRQGNRQPALSAPAQSNDSDLPF